MKRRKYFSPPPSRNYGGWTILEVKPRPGDPDPSTMIDVQIGGPNIPQWAIEQSGHAPATNPAKEPGGDAR